MIGKKKIAFVTLGCKVNQYDSQLLRESFRKCQYQEVAPEEKADIFVINSCTVTCRSDQKTRKAIRNIRRNNPHSFIVVTGCYAERAQAVLAAMPEIDMAVGNSGKSELVNLVHYAVTGHPLEQSYCHSEEIYVSGLEGHTRTFVKIQDGCRSFCSYCIVPYVRGPLTSRSPEQIEHEIRNLLQHGSKEIVLVGIHLGQYGQESGSHWDLCSLLEKISALPFAFRLRLSSIEINEISDRLLAIIAESANIVPHLHLPLQAGDDQVLQRMKRHYTTDQFARLCDNIRKKLSEPALSTDVIVGFPGETDKQFANSLSFCRRIGFSKMHIFPYADREGTAAFTMQPKVPAKVKKQRRQELQQVADHSARQYHNKFIGKTMRVLTESFENGVYSGLSDRYIRAVFTAPQEVRNQLIEIRVTEATAGGVSGELESKPKDNPDNS